MPWRAQRPETGRPSASSACGTRRGEPEDPIAALAVQDGLMRRGEAAEPRPAGGGVEESRRDGHHGAEIAAPLFLAESAIKSHLSSPFEKLDVGSREEATALVPHLDAGLGNGILGRSEGEHIPAPASTLVVYSDYDSLAEVTEAGVMSLATGSPAMTMARGRRRGQDRWGRCARPVGRGETENETRPVGKTRI